MKPFPPGSQQARLLVMLRAGPVSHLQAMVEGIGRCSDVVLKLRRRGYVISMQMDSMVNTRGLMVHFGRYWLLREPNNLPKDMSNDNGHDFLSEEDYNKIAVLLKRHHGIG